MTVTTLESLRSQVYEEASALGRKDGYEEGYEEGHRAGYQAGQESGYAEAREILNSNQSSDEPSALPALDNAR